MRHMPGSAANETQVWVVVVVVVVVKVWFVVVLEGKLGTVIHARPGSSEEGDGAAPAEAGDRGEAGAAPVQLAADAGGAGIPGKVPSPIDVGPIIAGGADSLGRSKAFAGCSATFKPASDSSAPEPSLTTLRCLTFTAPLSCSIEV